MDTVRVDICYRPLRIAWAIRADDIDAFREAVRLSYTLWGGHFNPIVMVDHEEEASQLIDLFRVDLIFPIGDSKPVKEFPKRFPHLTTLFLANELFVGGANERTRAQVLDIQNAFVDLRGSPDLRNMNEKGARVCTWQPDDPLTDVFLVQFGMYPSTDEVDIDYLDMLMHTIKTVKTTIDLALPIAEATLGYLTIAYLSKYGLERHYSVPVGWDYPGFFVGDATNCDDLVTHWNLRASDIPLWFVDPNHLQRYTGIIPAWEKQMRELVSNRRHESDRRVAVWCRRENIGDAKKPFGDLQLSICPISTSFWNGCPVRPPMMYFDQVSTLGVIGREGGKPKVSFPLNDKPFCDDPWFRTQHLVASMSFMGSLYGDELHTLDPPFIPELNKFFSRTIHWHYGKLRILNPNVLGSSLTRPRRTRS